MSLKIKMNKYRVISFTTVLIFVFANALSHADNEWKLKPIRIAIGLSQPPYIIASEQRGMEYEIVKEALEIAGYKLYPKFVEFGDEPQQFKDNLVDGALTMKIESGYKSNYSEEYITYHNYAMTLESSGLKIESVEDLADKSVSAFQDARLYLGPGFKQMSKTNPGYHETPVQLLQNIELYTGKVDVVIADINIFNWYNKDPRVTDLADFGNKVIYHNIFKPTHYRVAFRDTAARDAFNTGLAELKSSGRYQEIADKYNIAN